MAPIEQAAGNHHAVFMGGHRWPTTAEACRALLPGTYVRLLERLRDDLGGTLEVRVVFDGPPGDGRSESIFPEHTGYTIGRAVQAAIGWFGGAPNERWILLRATAQWEPLDELARVLLETRGYALDRVRDVPVFRAVPRLSDARGAREFHDMMSAARRRGPNAFHGTSIEWIAPTRLPAPDALVEVLGAVGRMAGMLRDQCLGTVESIVASAVRDERALCWLEAENVPMLMPDGRAEGFARLACEIAAFRAAYGQPLLLEPEVERLRADLIDGFREVDPALWDVTRGQAERSGDDDVLLHAAALGQAVAARWPDPFYRHFSHTPVAARVLPFQDVIWRASDFFRRFEGGFSPALEITRRALGLS